MRALAAARPFNVQQIVRADVSRRTRLGTQVRDAGRAYSQVSDPGQKGSVEFVIKMDNAKQETKKEEDKIKGQIGSSVYCRLIFRNDQAGLVRGVP